MAQRIGFIGVGLMGHGKAKTLLEKGFSVMAMAHRKREPLEDLLQRGATEGANPGEIAEASDVVILCVTGTPQVEEIIYGDNGVLASSRPGLMVVDCSTSEPASTAKICADLNARGTEMADAPLARTPIQAEEGKLNTMVGASEEVFTAIRPVLETFCENIFHIGPVGTGHKLKLLNNFLAMGYGALIAEALCACAATGIDLQKYYDVVSAGGANSGIFQLIVPKALEGDYTGLPFSLANAEKDLRYYQHMIEGIPLTGAMSAAVHHAFVQGCTLGFGNDFVGSLIQVQSKINGVDIR